MIGHFAFAGRLKLPLHFSGTIKSFVTLGIFLTYLTITPATAITPEEILSDPALEQRARTLSKQLRCLVCQNQSIDDSDADLARDLRNEVRDQIEAGKSNAIIIDQLRQKYGDYVLLNPPISRETVFLWLAPIGFIGLGTLIVILARRQQVNSPLVNLDAKDHAQIKKILDTRNDKKKT